MDFSFGPLDPVEFREGCTAIYHWAERDFEQKGEHFDLMLGAAMFFKNYYKPREGEGFRERRSTIAYMRLLALVNLLKNQPEADELLRPSSREAHEFHLGVFEAAALAPMKPEGRFAVEDFLAAARTRVKDIGRLQAMLGE